MYNHTVHDIDFKKQINFVERQVFWIGICTTLMNSMWMNSMWMRKI